ncbi:MAG: glucosamine-6-phosphate deaminase [Acidobacteria bacterium]|nr:glucosamine-6-phosphate deaminase [Acidobacteriota bacterium]MBI3424900.1 glucosamine-6-phosphate deaminase [Acidobacteriota bacterium]
MEIPITGLLHQFRADQLNVYVYETRAQMGAAAAAAVAAELRRLIRERQRAIGIFAAAPSQNEFLAALVATPDIEWTGVIAFHLDEYLGLDEEAPQSFRHYLIERLVKRVPLAEFHGLRGEAANPAAVCANYAALLAFKPPDFAALGIGENGHLAFNDPPVCDFNDPETVKIVELDEACRQQQVNDGCFPTLDAVPRRALTLTIPTLMACAKLFLSVPGPRKQQAVKKTLQGPITTGCPASILRMHKDAHLFLDQEAATLAL